MVTQLGVFFQVDLIAFCKSKNINVMAYCPLGSAWDRSPEKHGCKLMQHEVVIKAAEVVGKSPAQVCVALDSDPSLKL